MAGTIYNHNLWDKALEKVHLSNKKPGSTKPERKKPDLLIVSVKTSKPFRLSLETSKTKPKAYFNLEILRLMLIQILVPLIYFSIRVFLLSAFGFCTIGYNVDDLVEIGSYAFFAFSTSICYQVYKKADLNVNPPARWMKIGCELTQVIGFILAMKLTWHGVCGSELPFGKTCFSGSLATIVQVIITLIGFYNGILGIAFIILTV